ncbi:DNA alkylation repair protein [Haloechinothrix salitolerans]|uniref:DNA alkylation repair protein n=1 Tax=Haloechinothrix salitolerans TaxID=926830 RepID=A0ABW2C4E5_9PSEU
MTTPAKAADHLHTTLAGLSSPALAESLQRYFPGSVAALGVSNAAVATLANDYVKAHDLTPADRLEITELLLRRATYHEEVLLAFAVLEKVARRSFDAMLLDRFRRWLETVVSNWAQCDDLCLKVVYQFLLGHPDLITATRDWLGSASPWARRAANVAVVKFVRRKIGAEIYRLPLDVVFGNSLRLIDDPDPYVQKSIGWLLKVASVEHPQEVVTFLRDRGGEMARATLRIAVEKFDPNVRRSLLTVGTGPP